MATAVNVRFGAHGFRLRRGRGPMLPNRHNRITSGLPEIAAANDMVSSVTDFTAAEAATRGPRDGS